MINKKWSIQSAMAVIMAASAFTLAVPAEAAVHSKAVRSTVAAHSKAIHPAAAAKKPTDAQKTANVKISATIKKEIEAAVGALKDKKVEAAAEHLANVDALVKQAAKSGLTITNKLMKDATAKWPSTLAEFNKKGTLFIASSTNASKPTTFGPAKGTQSLKTNVYIFVGKNEQILLKNLKVDANIFVKSSSTGAGLVYFDHVSVNKVNGFGGSVVVAEHSLHLKEVQAEGIIVNDPNDASVVADSGVKVKTLAVSEAAGAAGVVTLESKENGSFSTVALASKDKAGVVLKGNFSSSAVTVTGKNAQVRVAKGAAVNSVEIKSEAKLSAEGGSSIHNVSLSADKSGAKIELAGFFNDSVVTIANSNAAISLDAGTNVGNLKKAPGVTGVLSIDNKGTIAMADGGITVKGNQPVVVDTPNPVPVVIKPVLKSIEARFTTGSPVMDDHGTVSLKDVKNDQIFQGVVITTDQTGPVKLKITSVTALGSDSNFLSAPRELPVSNDTPLTVSDLLGNSGTGSGGVKMETLRAFFMDKPIILKGTLIYAGPNGGESDPIVINLYL